MSVEVAVTLGRMQDNEPLMRALSGLINLNEPDLVLFVGEALVGNDAVDQLTKFNQRLADLSRSVKPHLIDGIVLTKFDTIDDKVCAFAFIPFPVRWLMDDRSGQPVPWSTPRERPLCSSGVVRPMSI